MTNSLDKDVLAVLRDERHEKGPTFLTVSFIRSRVVARIRKKQRVMVWVLGPLWEFVCAPSKGDVRASLHALQKDHPNLVRVKVGELYPRQARPNSRNYLHLVR